MHKQKNKRNVKKGIGNTKMKEGKERGDEETQKEIGETKEKDILTP
jgi:hypothetical protein